MQPVPEGFFHGVFSTPPRHYMMPPPRTMICGRFLSSVFSFSIRPSGGVPVVLHHSEDVPLCVLAVGHPPTPLIAIFGSSRDTWRGDIQSPLARCKVVGDASSPRRSHSVPDLQFRDSLAIADSSNFVYVGFLGTIAARRGDSTTARRTLAKFDTLRRTLSRPSASRKRRSRPNTRRLLLHANVLQRELLGAPLRAPPVGAAGSVSAVSPVLAP